MLRIVLPSAASVSALKVSIGIIYKSVVAVDVDIVVASPTTVPAPATAPSSAHSYPNTERDRPPCRVIANRRIVNGRIRVERRSINYRGVVSRDINHFRICLFDNDDLLALDSLDLYLLLLVAFKASLFFCLCTHSLYSVHHLALLREKSVA
jgi:hypothetical protein